MPTSFFSSIFSHVLTLSCLVTAAISADAVTTTSTDGNVVTTVTDDTTVSIQGEWDTTYNTMKLYQSDTTIVGTYEFDSGELVGEVRGQVLYGWWREEGNTKSCGPESAWSGPFIFTFNDLTSRFTGDWGSCDVTFSDLDAMATKWTGTLISRDVIDAERPTGISTDGVTDSASTDSSTANGTSSNSTVSATTVYDPSTDANLSNTASVGVRAIYNAYVAAKENGEPPMAAFDTAMGTTTTVFSAYGVETSVTESIIADGRSLFEREISEGRDDLSAFIYVVNYMVEKAKKEIAKQEVATYIDENGVTEANFNETHLNELIAIVENLGIAIDDTASFRQLVIGIIRENTSTITSTSDCASFNQITNQCMDSVYYLEEHAIETDDYNGTITSQADKNSREETVQLIQYAVASSDGSIRESSLTLPDSSQLQNMVDRYVSTLNTSLGSVRIETEADGRAALSYLQDGKRTGMIVPPGFTTVLNEDGSATSKVQTDKAKIEIANRKDGVVWAVIELEDRIIHHMVPMESNSSTSEVLSKADFLARQTTSTNSAQKSRALSDDDFYAVVNSFESSRNFTAYEREGEESVVVEVDSESASFDDAVTVDEERTIILTEGEATLTNQDGSTQEMETGVEYEIPVTEAEETDYRTIWKEGEMTLVDGWNLIAIPVNESVVDIQQNFGDYEVAWSYSAKNVTWIKNPDSIFPGEALWINTSAKSLSFEGTDYGIDTGALVPGWNLLGIGSEIEDITVSFDFEESYKYQEGSWTRNPLKVFRGQGVWVKFP